MKNLFIIILAMIGISFQSFALTPAERKSMSTINNDVRKEVISNLKKKVSEAKHQIRIERGVKQVAEYWNEKHGSIDDFKSFCYEYFATNDEDLNALFNSISNHMETIFGHFNKISLDLKRPVHLDIAPPTKFDVLISGYEPYDNLTSNFFDNKLAHIINLNFPFYSLNEKNTLGKNWSRLEWAFARVGDMFAENIPTEIRQESSTAIAASDNYISNYNIYMGYLVDKKGNTMFPKDMKLITHWNLRDEIKSLYGDKKNLEKQELIYQVMLRIITQTIPEIVINSDKCTWNPITNQVFAEGRELEAKPEPNTRYKHLLNNFKARKLVDQYSPNYPTYINAKFDGDMEIPQAEVERIFKELLTAPVAKDVAKLIKKRLGRDLKPFDIWYDGFKSRSTISQDELNGKTKAKYPNPAAFAKDIPVILEKLGFEPSKAMQIASRIDVDPSRGAGHAWGAEMRTEKAHLRTRIGKDGMDYKGYNIAVHELGHNVEQTLTLYDIDNYMMRGVPNTAFTEAWAFSFQSRDLMLLGMKNEDKNKEYLDALDNYWATFEIMGVSIVDMRVWNWMYANPNCTEAELNAAVNKIATEVWNEFFAPVIGVKDSPILGIYSHMIDNPLYLSAYPVGHLIEFQIQQFVKDKNLAQEMQRMLKQGRLTPELWMHGAVGSGITAKPMVDATIEAINNIK